MADVPQGFSPRDVDRLRRMLAAFEAGNLTNRNASTPGRTQGQTLLVFKVEEDDDVKGGKYKLTLWQPTPGEDGDITKTDDLAEEDFGKEVEDTESFEYLGIYPPEVGSGSHSLGVGTFVVGFVRRWQVIDGKNVGVVTILGDSVRIFITITGHEDLGSNQWKYSAKLVKRTADLTFEDIPDTEPVTAFNVYESGNDASTTVVNDITIDSQVKALKPVPNGKTVLVQTVLVKDPDAETPEREYFFTAPNEWDVECEADDAGGGS